MQNYKTTMQEENDQQTVNSHLLITTVSKFLMPEFPEFRDYMKNLTNFLKWMESVERLENMPHAFPCVSESWMLFGKKVVLFTEPGDVVRSVSPFWQFFFLQEFDYVFFMPKKSAISYATERVSNTVEPSSHDVTHWKGHFFHSRQRNEIVCITEHFAEATAPSWLVCNGLWRVIRYGPGHKAGIKCCPLPLAARGVYKENLSAGTARPKLLEWLKVRQIFKSFLLKQGARAERATSVTENPIINQLSL